MIFQGSLVAFFISIPAANEKCLILYGLIFRDSVTVKVPQEILGLRSQIWLSCGHLVYSTPANYAVRPF